MDVLTDFVPFLPVFGIVIVGGVFSIYICFYGVPNDPNTPEFLHQSPDVESQLLVLDSS